MSYESPLPPGTPIIDDSNADIFAARSINQDGKFGTGYDPRDYDKFPIGYAAPAADDDIIPERDWIPLIRKMDSERSQLFHILDDAESRGEFKVKHQLQTPLCWMFGVTTCQEAAGVVAGAPYISLSPASVASQITNYRLRGGWGSEALKGLREFGAVPSAHWADTAMDRRLDTPQTRGMRKRHKTTEWVDVVSNRMSRDERYARLVTRLLRRRPTAAAFNWWRHLTAFIGLVVRGGEVRPKGLNSWGVGWGERGRFELSGSRKYPDEVVSITVATGA